MDGNVLQIEYSSPSVRGREIFGEGDDYLVPFNEMWRTGANEATVFSTGQDILLDTFKLPAGKYALFTIPSSETWEIIFNKEWNQWGSHYHKESLDAVRLFVQAESLNSSQEQMRFYFEDNKLKFRWSNVGWSIPISLIE